MADRYWVGGTGNWSDNLNHWAASSGGLPNETKPTSSDNVFFDGSSFSGAGQTVTVDETANCLTMNWTGATNNPTLDNVNFDVNVYGDLTFIAAMTWTASTNEGINFTGSNNISVTTNGNTALGGQFALTGYTGTVTLQDDLTVLATSSSSALLLFQGGLDTNGKTVTLSKAFYIDDATAKTLTMGASIITCAGFNYAGSNMTVTANTATINITGTGTFAGGGITTYHIVNLNGTAHTISGSNTFSILGFNSTGAQTITFTDGTTQRVGSMRRAGIGTITFAGTGVAGYTITKIGGGIIDLYNLSISYSTVNPIRGVWFATGNFTNGGNNTGWIFGKGRRIKLLSLKRH